jgi:hypothetical protein
MKGRPAESVFVGFVSSVFVANSAAVIVVEAKLTQEDTQTGVGEIPTLHMYVTLREEKLIFDPALL